MRRRVLNSRYRELLRHTGVFGAGAILFRLASIALLPVYTRYLQPADYGIIALLDLTINLLAILAGAGIGAAATRAHFRDGENVSHDCVWWTAIFCEIGVASVIVIPALAQRSQLAAVVFGSGVTDGGRYMGLALATLWVSSLTAVMDSYFRARKASSFIVALGLMRLFINVALNVTFVVGYGMGVAGVLWGNLISAAIVTAVEAGPFIAAHTRVRFDWGLAMGYWRFGWPLILYGLCSAAMHESDRYVLRLFVNLHDLGLYSLAYQIGQGVNTLVMTPFSGIWSVLIYEIARDPDAKATYAKVFKHYVFGLSLVLMIAALFARPILGLIAPPEYAPAAEIVPIICLAYFFFSVHDHFKVPALLASRTVALLPAVMSAAAANLALNFLLIPRMGVAGAAWASVLTFALFSSIALHRNRRIDRYPYPFVSCAVVAVGMCATYAAHRMLSAVIDASMQLAVAIALSLAWAVFVFGIDFRRGMLGAMMPGRDASLRRSGDPVLTETSSQSLVSASESHSEAG